MYEFLRVLHSILRYLLLFGGIAAIIYALKGIKNAATVPRLKAASLIFLIFTHTQFLIGMCLYIINKWYVPFLENFGEAMKIKTVRFFGFEHITMMLIATILITIGHSKVKKAIVSQSSVKTSAILFIIAMVIVLAAVPWPFRDLGRDWIYIP
jgi:hypothetical protein